MVERVQQSRARGWRMPPNTVSVARPHRWGNSFRVARADDGRWVVTDAQGTPVAFALTKPEAHRVAVNLFRASITPEIARAARAELGGRNLACFCSAGTPCHVDVLLEIANGGAS